MTCAAQPTGSAIDHVCCGALAVAVAFGAMHAVVDAVSVAVLAQESGMGAGGEEAAFHLNGTGGWDLYLLYSGLAFGAQLPIGVLADRWGLYRAAVPIALAALAAALAAHHAAPLAAIVLVGLGNAAFHVGAGASVLKLVPRRASAIGVFVGPGAVGLAAGIRLPQDCPGQWAAIAWGLLAASLAGWLAIAVFSRPLGLREEPPTADDEKCESRTESPGKRLALVCLAALVAAIALRSTAGLTAGQIHSGEEALLGALAIAACGGKMLGGFVADRFGWLATSVVTLLISLPLLSLCGGHGLAAVAGMVLFQMTMPVTSIALYRLLPREPGLAFGLASLALLLGAIVVFLHPDPWPQANLALAGLILVSIPTVVLGIRPLTAGRREVA
jgi:FSR family fosmidomycin resistance protein-like MFS transporter